MKQRNSIKKGDRVKILEAPHISGLKHRKGPVYGRVTKIDGGYIYVRPSWCAWDVELYENEIERAD